MTLTVYSYEMFTWVSKLLYLSKFFSSLNTAQWDQPPSNMWHFRNVAVNLKTHFAQICFGTENRTIYHCYFSMSLNSHRHRGICAAPKGSLPSISRLK